MTKEKLIFKNQRYYYDMLLDRLNMYSSKQDFTKVRTLSKIIIDREAKEFALD